MTELKEENLLPVERYLLHLYKIFQREPEFYRNESLIEGVNNLTAIVYRDFPTIGYMTAVTYGLSLVDHPEWKFGRNELCICVESEEINWGIVIGNIANQMRGKFPFLYGNTIRFGQQISKDSEMDAFLVFAPTIFEKDECMNIDIGLEYTINWASLFPIYSSEIEIYNQIGIEKFWQHPNFDPYKVNREKITGEN